MDLRSGYFVGSLLIGIPYLIIFLTRRNLRKEMIFGSFILLPFVFTAPFFIPEYWNPPYLFGHIYPFKVGIEDFLFIFFVGGIAAVIFEFIESKKELKLKKSKFTRTMHFIPIFIAILLVWVLEYIFPNLSIINLIIACLIISFYMIWTRRDLLIQSLTSGLLFTTLYFLLFCLFNFIYPDFVANIYNHQNLLGSLIYKVPLEEIVFAFVTGSAWSIFYEFALNYRTSNYGRR